ncbi:hypothetical protein [Metallosphaera sedula]|uniref:hypothetical protein n=1 Tax=Metallosphaera sedula TaxID=43687 RepID=UPI0020C06833|nr:hypothetical protein [Metallosphaera sedula]BBL48347.1 hypothetical protein MJ1HA_2469 [Metallosphaera sedula]
MDDCEIKNEAFHYDENNIHDYRDRITKIILEDLKSQIDNFLSKEGINMQVDAKKIQIEFSGSPNYRVNKASKLTIPAYYNPVDKKIYIFHKNNKYICITTLLHELYHYYLHNGIGTWVTGIKDLEEGLADLLSTLTVFRTRSFTVINERYERESILLCITSSSFNVACSINYAESFAFWATLFIKRFNCNLANMWNTIIINQDNEIAKYFETHMGNCNLCSYYFNKEEYSFCKEIKNGHVNLDDLCKESDLS